MKYRVSVQVSVWVPFVGESVSWESVEVEGGDGLDAMLEAVDEVRRKLEEKGVWKYRIGDVSVRKVDDAVAQLQA